MEYKIENRSKYIPVKVTLTLNTPEELVEFFWRMALYNRELHGAVGRRRNAKKPNLTMESSLHSIGTLRSDLVTEIHNQNLHTTKQETK